MEGPSTLCGRCACKPSRLYAPTQVSLRVKRYAHSTRITEPHCWAGWGPLHPWLRLHRRSLGVSHQPATEVEPHSHPSEWSKRFLADESLPPTSSASAKARGVSQTGLSHLPIRVPDLPSPTLPTDRTETGPPQSKIRLRRTEERPDVSLIYRTSKSAPYPLIPSPLIKPEIFNQRQRLFRRFQSYRHAINQRQSITHRLLSSQTRVCHRPYAIIALPEITDLRASRSRLCPRP